MERLGVAVVGAGLLGSRHARVWNELADTELLWVVDSDLDRAQSVSARWGGRPAPDLGAMLADPRVRAVSVATPDHLHAELVLRALRSGRDVLVEKPLATTSAEARAMIEEARQRDLILKVNFSQRHLAEYRAIKELVASGGIGQPATVLSVKRDRVSVPEAMLSWAAHSTPIYFMTSHDLDLVGWYLGAQPVWVSARERSLVLRTRGSSQAHDGVHALVGFRDGTEATFSSLWSYPETYPMIAEDQLEVVGTKGLVRYTSRGRLLEIFTDRYARQSTFSGPATADEVGGRLAGAFVDSLSDFVRCVESRTQPESLAEDSLVAVRCQEAILQSARSNGRSVDLGVAGR